MFEHCGLVLLNSAKFILPNGSECGLKVAGLAKMGTFDVILKRFNNSTSNGGETIKY